MRSLAILASIFLAGCAVHQPEAEFRTTYLVCGGANRIDISHDGRTAVLRDLDGTQVTLNRTPSDLGIRYEGEGVSILRSGDTYVYQTRNGQSLSCAPLER